MNAK
jgi:hypothetical protein